MNIRDAINNAPDDWYVDIRSRGARTITSWPIKDLKAVIRQEDIPFVNAPDMPIKVVQCKEESHGRPVALNIREGVNVSSWPFWFTMRGTILCAACGNENRVNSSMCAGCSKAILPGLIAPTNS